MEWEPFCLFVQVFLISFLGLEYKNLPRLSQGSAEWKRTFCSSYEANFRTCPQEGQSAALLGWHDEKLACGWTPRCVSVLLFNVYSFRRGLCCLACGPVTQQPYIWFVTQQHYIWFVTTALQLICHTTTLTFDLSHNSITADLSHNSLTFDLSHNSITFDLSQQHYSWFVTQQPLHLICHTIALQLICHNSLTFDLSHNSLTVGLWYNSLTLFWFVTQ